jgi:hypothetical protein
MLLRDQEAILEKKKKALLGSRTEERNNTTSIKGFSVYTIQL